MAHDPGKPQLSPTALPIREAAQLLSKAGGRLVTEAMPLQEQRELIGRGSDPNHSVVKKLKEIAPGAPLVEPKTVADARLQEEVSAVFREILTTPRRGRKPSQGLAVGHGEGDVQPSGRVPSRQPLSS